MKIRPVTSVGTALRVCDKDCRNNEQRRERNKKLHEVPENPYVAPGFKWVRVLHLIGSANTRGANSLSALAVRHFPADLPGSFQAALDPDIPAYSRTASFTSFTCVFFLSSAADTKRQSTRKVNNNERSFQ